MNKLLFVFALSIFAFACKSNKVESPQDSIGKKLTFSHGGGFTGKYNTYCLLENGQLFKASETKGVMDKQKSLPQDITDQIFSNYDILGLSEMKVQTYGNLLYSITMEDGDNDNKISWEKGDKGSETLQLFFRNVMNQIKKNNDNDSDPKKSNINAKF
ncbi:MAG: hypothetical protein ACJA1A_001021 [Saprospiraceae bacterium]|jgi:hypothetical protein|tara:strand:+ start:1594 stop:2067 length:474 start_codon:yes stop_codon:yes gene_type:complete